MNPGEGLIQSIAMTRWDLSKCQALSTGVSRNWQRAPARCQPLPRIRTQQLFSRRPGGLRHPTRASTRASSAAVPCVGEAARHLPGLVSPQLIPVEPTASQGQPLQEVHVPCRRDLSGGGEQTVTSLRLDSGRGSREDERLTRTVNLS